MSSRSREGTSPALRIAAAGFALAAIGVTAGFIGFAVSQREISLAGFAICALGIAIGFCGILYGWVRHGPEIAKELRARYLR